MAAGWPTTVNSTAPQKHFPTYSFAMTVLLVRDRHGSASGVEQEADRVHEYLHERRIRRERVVGAEVLVDVEDHAAATAVRVVGDGRPAVGDRCDHRGRRRGRPDCAAAGRGREGSRKTRGDRVAGVDDGPVLEVVVLAGADDRH